MNKIAILFTNYGPYHLSRVQTFQYVYQSEVIGLEISRDGVDYQWRTNLNFSNFTIYSILDHLRPNQVSTRVKILKTFGLLSNLNVDVVVIAGYARLPMLIALFWSLWYRKPAILLSESKEDDEPRIWWKEIIKKWLISNYSSALVGGNPHKNYLIKLGFPENAIFTGYDVVNNNTFHPTTIKNLPSPLKHPFFLAINRFVQKKNLPFLLSAYASYQQHQGDTAWHLVLCGDGELRPELENQISQHNLQNFVHLSGFLQQEDLLPYFAHAQCFIHASTTEQWGLVVNEAMAAGLPVLVSNRCGCFEDLVTEGVNGFGFDPENQDQLIYLMLKMSSGDVDLEAMGSASLQQIQNFTPEHFAEGLKQAIQFALDHR